MAILSRAPCNALCEASTNAVVRSDGAADSDLAAGCADMCNRRNGTMLAAFKHASTATYQVGLVLCRACALLVTMARRFQRHSWTTAAATAATGRTSGRQRRGAGTAARRKLTKRWSTFRGAVLRGGCGARPPTPHCRNRCTAQVDKEVEVLRGGGIKTLLQRQAADRWAEWRQRGHCLALATPKFGQAAAWCMPCDAVHDYC